jgi:hypothetical protein
MPSRPATPTFFATIASYWAALKGWQRTAIIVVATLAALFIRRPDAFFRPQFWAEDFIFLILAEKLGWVTFTLPQSGYLHLMPRTIAWTATRLDPALQPAFFLLGWLIVLFAVVFSCLSRRLDLPYKPLLAAAVVLVPHTGEVFFNPTNVQWVAALGLLLTAFKAEPVRWLDWLVDILFVVFSGLSGPFAMFTLPLFARRLWNRRTAASAFLLTGVIAAALIQSWFIYHSPPDLEFVGPFSAYDLVVNIAYRLPDNVFFGALLTGAAGQSAALIVGAITLAFVGFSVWQIGRVPEHQLHRRDIAWFIGYLVCLLGITTIRKRFDLWGFGDITNGDRYFFIAKVILLWITIAACGAAQQRWLKWSLALLLVCSITTNLPRFRFAHYIDTHWYAQCADIRAGREVEVRINPGWRFKYRRGSVDSFGPLQ